MPELRHVIVTIDAILSPDIRCGEIGFDASGGAPDEAKQW
jgi:hypothetical protein